MTEAAHSRVAPSAAARWVQCPGSVRMSEGLPEVSTDESEEGVVAHEVARIVAQGYPAPQYATPEMVEGAHLYRGAVGVQPLLRWFEKRYSMPQIHPEAFGTPDYVAVDGQTFTVVDYKFGHRFVEAFENWQLIDYMAGLFNASGINETGAAHIVCRFVIVQPRAYRRGGFVREWTVTGDKLAPYFQRLREAAHEALGPNPRLRVGDECRDCPGRIRCPELQRQAHHAAELAAGQVPFDMPPDGVGFELRQLHAALAVLKSRIEGLEGLALGMIKAGERVPFYAVEHGQPRERWKASDAEIETLGRLLKVDLFKRAPITPNQARALVVDASVINAYSVKPTGEAKLVPENLAQARKVFA
jgi:hypothetical protein